MEAVHETEIGDDEGRRVELFTIVAFDAFYRAHYRGVLRTALGLTRDRGAAEDLTQEAFLAARQNWDEISQYDRPDLFVRRVVVNRSHSRFRSIGREAHAMRRMWGRRSDAEIMTEPVPEVWTAIASLPERQAQVVILRIIEDLSTNEVAEILGCGPETVRTHMRRAKRKLAELLEDPQ